jgi:hypothetical protein
VEVAVSSRRCLQLHYRDREWVPMAEPLSTANEEEPEIALDQTADVMAGLPHRGSTSGGPSPEQP